MPSPAARPLEIAALTHVGNVRKRNEDFVLARRLDPPAPLGALALVCDGVGGYPCGDLASRLAGETFAETVRAALESPAPPSRDADFLALLDRAAQDAHDRLLERMTREPRSAGMATTLSAALVADGRLFTAQVGDSRIYRLRGGRLEQITDDQSPVAELARSGELTKEQARSHPQRHIVSQTLGFARIDLQPDCRVETISPGDLLLLCTDGLPDSLEDAVLESLLLQSMSHSLRHAADALLEAALRDGGRDNITLALLKFA